MPEYEINYPLKYMLGFRNFDTKIHELTVSSPKYVKLSDKSYTFKEKGGFGFLTVKFDTKR